MVDILAVAVRAAGFVLLLQAAGIALFVAIFGDRLSSSAAGVQRVGAASALLAIVAVIGHFVLQAGRLAGDLSGVWSAELQGTVLHSASGAEAGLRILGLLLIAAGLRRGAGAAASSRLGVTSAVVGATLAAVAFALTGHTSVSPERWFLGAALALHVLVVAFWLGALPCLYLATLRESEPAAAKVVAAFSSAATWIVPGIFIAGAVLAVGLVPGFATFERPYGVLLLVKIGGFAALMVIAASNKWRLAPALARGEPRAAASLRCAIAAEYVLIAAVLAATAIMTTFFSPQ
jgi:putative copper resistance protein D